VSKIDRSRFISPSGGMGLALPETAGDAAPPQGEGFSRPLRVVVVWPGRT